nr:hypothetical protein [Sodalis glossinidius]
MSLASLVLVINCGSSSLKFSAIPLNDDAPVLSGLAEKLGQAERPVLPSKMRRVIKQRSD